VGWIALLVAAAGFAGGLINAILTDGGFVAPQTQTLADGRRIWRPGWLGTAAVGSAASLVLWGLYGPLATVMIIGESLPGNPRPMLSVFGLIGAFLTGAGGGRVLTSEVDKHLLNVTKTELTRSVATMTEMQDKESRR
jgi:hypothetical protein